MTKLRTRGPKIATQTSDKVTPETSENIAEHPLTHVRVSQNSDGSWSSESQGVHTGVDFPAETFVRRRRPTLMTPPGYFVATNAVESEPEQSKPQNSRGMKRKAQDDDFSLGHIGKDDSDTLVSPEKATKKSKSTGKRKTEGSRRVTPAAYHANNQLNKPEPHGNPEVWADKRQQLCETLRYFNAYQSGAYTNDGIAYGHLIDAEVDARDKFDEHIVITSV
jgi:hypothetical protein